METGRRASGQRATRQELSSSVGFCGLPAAIATAIGHRWQWILGAAGAGWLVATHPAGQSRSEPGICHNAVSNVAWALTLSLAQCPPANSAHLHRAYSRWGWASLSIGRRITLSGRSTGVTTNNCQCRPRSSPPGHSPIGYALVQRGRCKAPANQPPSATRFLGRRRHGAAG